MLCVAVRADAGADQDRRRVKLGLGTVQPDNLGPAAKVDQRVPGDPVKQERFQVGLVEHVRLREAVHPWVLVAAELGHDAVPGVEQAQAAGGPRPGQERLADTDPMQDPGDLVIQVHRPGQRMRLCVAFEQGDGDPETGQEQGRGAADRAGAGNDDGRVGIRVHLVSHGVFPMTVLVCVPRSRRPSGQAIVAVITSPSCRYRGLAASCLKNSFHLVAGGSRPASRSMIFGGAFSAVPPGVPVSSRSPGAIGWNRDSRVSAWRRPDDHVRRRGVLAHLSVHRQPQPQRTEPGEISRVRQGQPRADGGERRV